MREKYDLVQPQTGEQLLVKALRKSKNHRIEDWWDNVLTVVELDSNDELKFCQIKATSNVRQAIDS